MSHCGTPVAFFVVLFHVLLYVSHISNSVEPSNEGSMPAGSTSDKIHVNFKLDSSDVAFQ